MNGIKINGFNYDWGDVCIVNTLTGLTIECTGIKYTKKQDKELVFGLGNEPLGTGNGQIHYDGSITLKKSGVDKLNEMAKDRGADDILGIPGAEMNIVVVYMNGYKLHTDTLVGICFTELPSESKAGDKTFDVNLPFIFLRMNRE